MWYGYVDVILAVVMRVMRYGVVPQMDTGMRVAAVPLDALVDLTRTHTIHHDGDGDDAHDDEHGEDGILRRVVPWLEQLGVCGLRQQMTRRRVNLIKPIRYLLLNL